MRYLLIAMALLASCHTTKTMDCPPCPEPMAVVVDTTAYHGLLLKNDSLLTVIAGQAMDMDSMANRIDTYAHMLRKERTTIESIKKYVRIVNNNRTQQKFLLGWMNRALSE